MRACVWALAVTSALAALDPDRFKLSGYGPASPEDVSELARIAGGPVDEPQEIPQDQKAKYPAVEQLAAKDIETKSIVVRSFLMEKTAVSNAQFARFIEDTGLETDADAAVWSMVQKQLLPRGKKPNKMHPQGIPKDWTIMKWAAWHRPFANGTEVAGVRDDHPVVHVSWNDAYLYCLWAGRRLPSEAEWELAARGGGAPGRVFPWGDEPTPGGKHMCNAWDGPFPRRKKGFKTIGGDADGFLDTCPVREFPPDGNGLYNMVGNVWEWTMSRYRQGHGNSVPPQQALRGGSYIGALVPEPAPAGRVRAGITARQGYYPDTGFGDAGFRCAQNLPGKRAPADVEMMMRVLGPHMFVKLKKRPAGSSAKGSKSGGEKSSRKSGGGGGGGGSKKAPLSTKNVKLYAGVGLLLICVLAVALGGGGDDEEAAPAAAANDDAAKKEE